MHPSPMTDVNIPPGATAVVQSGGDRKIDNEYSHSDLGNHTITEPES